MRVAFQMYRGTFATWHQLFTEAAAFATRVGQERLIGISHSEDQGKGVVTVDGRMIENLHVEQAERALALAAAIKELQAA